MLPDWHLRNHNIPAVSVKSSWRRWLKLTGAKSLENHDDVINWKHFPCYWPFVRESTGHPYSDIVMSATASQITGVSIVYSTVCSYADQRKHQSSASLTFVRGIHRSSVNSPHKGPPTRKMFPFDDVIVDIAQICHQRYISIRQHR